MPNYPEQDPPEPGDVPDSGDGGDYPTVVVPSSDPRISGSPREPKEEGPP